MSRLLFPALVVLLAACTRDDPAQRPMRFYVVGDWGRDGQFGQWELAQTMNALAREEPPDFILSAGDNFYEDGVDGVADPQWNTSFEAIYNGPFLQVPWYVALGNHDYAGSVQAQLDYHNVNPRWNMPARYYTFVRTDPGGTRLRFVVLDTTPFERSYYSLSWSDHLLGQDTLRQRHWIDSVFRLQDADFTIALGHHPLYTGGARAQEPNGVREALEPLFTTHRIPVYLAGHEHDLQYLKDPAKPTHHLVSGAGSSVRPTGEIDITRFSKSVVGFVMLEAYATRLDVRFYSIDGDVIYESTITK
ncbi:MAG: metallophosphoesterase [Cyclobacteriaceae bacterium]|nr:metallophosphoesterase [Cyclobacteriaceae bacterium]